MSKRVVAFAHDALLLVRGGRKRMLRLPATVAMRYCVGDKLRGLEAFRIAARSWRIFQDGLLEVDYRAGGSRRFGLGFEAARSLVCCAGQSWHPAVLMDEWASRYRITILEIRREPLASITPEDVCAEGCAGLEDFYALWDRCHAQDGASVDTNPLVWAVRFDYEPVGVSDPAVEYDSEVRYE
jgi:hypothetical protein